jgi:hypothetical protein
MEKGRDGVIQEVRTFMDFVPSPLKLNMQKDKGVGFSKCWLILSSLNHLFFSSTYLLTLPPYPAKLK